MPHNLRLLKLWSITDRMERTKQVHLEIPSVDLILFMVIFNIGSAGAILKQTMKMKIVHFRS